MLTSSQLNCDVKVHPKPCRAERVALCLKRMSPAIRKDVEV